MCCLFQFPFFIKELGIVFGISWLVKRRKHMALVKEIIHYRGTIAVTFVVAGGLAVSLIWVMAAPEFTAKGEILVRPIIPVLVFRTEENGMIPLYESYKNTQAAIILGPCVLQRALDNPDVQKTDWYRNRENFLMNERISPMERLKKELKAQPRGQTEIVDVMMTTRNSKDAAIIVNAVLEEYIKFVRESSDSTKNLLYQKLAEEYDSLRNEIQGREKLIARLYRELGTSEPKDLVAQKRVRLDEAEAKLQTLDYEIALAIWQAKQMGEAAEINSREKKSTATQPGPDARYSQDDEWRGLYLLLRNREAQLAREGMGKSKGQSGRKETGLVLPADWETQRHRIKQLQYIRELLYTNFEKQRASFKQTLEIAQMLARENEEVRQKKKVFDAIRARKDEKEMERKVPGSIEINSQAMPISQPDKDRRIPFSAAALFGALAMGIGLAFLRVRIIPAISGTEEPAGRGETGSSGQAGG